jgi:uncharacterized iron-regulated membrane protein
MYVPDEPPRQKSWPDYRAVWRWHFYAGIFCIPFVVILSISGSIYLFKQEIESWLDRPYDNLSLAHKPAAASEQIRAAIAALPESTFESYELPEKENDAARVVVSHNGKATRVYVHPENLSILKTIPEEDRLMRVLFKLHGELLIGNRGSTIVELAASWTIIMIVTGLYLWWPRGVARLGGVVYPRLGSGRRVFWRDLHSVTGVWISGLALFLLLSGLPWAKFWGDYLKNIRRMTGTAVVRQDWTNGASASNSRQEAGGSGEHEMHRSSGRPARGERRGPVDVTAVDRIVATVAPLQLPAPVVIAAPGGRSFGSDPKEWTAKSLTANRTQRVDLVMDGASGAVKSRKDFGDRPLIDRIVGTGVAAHEGRLFGWANQLLGLMTAGGLVLVSSSAVLLWWRRREPGVLGAPRILVSPRFSWSLIVLATVFGVYLPLFGLSLIGVLFLEALVLRRIPRVRDWLGLEY